MEKNRTLYIKIDEQSSPKRLIYFAGKSTPQRFGINMPSSGDVINIWTVLCSFFVYLFPSLFPVFY